MKQSLNNSLIFLISLSFFFLSGCWSSHEIEERGFGVAMAFDKGEESQFEEMLKEQGAEFPKKDLITFTYQFINPTGTIEQGGGGEKPYINMSQTGDSVHQIVREISLKSERPVHSPHLKVVVISEELLNTINLKQILDTYLRENEIRLSCLLLVSREKASDILEIKNFGDIPAFRLIGISENQYRSTKVLPPLTLAKLAGKLNSDSSFLIQNVAAANGEVKFAGAAIINGKTNMWHGFFNAVELEGLTWLTGKGKGGVLKTYDDETGDVVVFEIKEMKSKITPKINGDNISFKVKIESEGRLSDDWVNAEKSSDEKFQKRVEKAAEKELEELVQNVLRKMQEEYKVDVAGFGEQLRIKHPRVWEKVKHDWDQTFSEAPIAINVKLSITDYGTTEAN